MGENYWELLGRAEQALAAGRLAEAERFLQEARETRERSPGRVFLSEKVGDALRRLWRRDDPGAAEGRWRQRERAFRDGFAAAADALWERVVPALRGGTGGGETSVFGPRGEGAPPPGPAVEDFVEAAHLAGRSRLAGPPPVPLADCLVAALLACRDARRLPPPELLTAPGPLSPREAVTVVAVGRDLFAAVGGEHADAARRVAGLLLELLPDGAAVTGAAAARRHWLEARLRDDLLGDPAAAGAYRAFLAVADPAAEETVQARRRLVDLLANLTGWHRPVPDYGEALQLVETAGDDPVLAAARQAVATRRGGSGTLRWASCWVDGDGTVWTVLWNDDRPADVLRWPSGHDPEGVSPLLAACGRRLLAGGAVPPGGPLWAVGPLRDVLLGDGRHGGEGWLEALLPTAGAEVWGRCAPHPVLRESACPDPVRRALAVGLAWRELLARLGREDPSVREGIRLLADRGDGPAGLVASFLPPPLQPVREWPLTPLGRRPAPSVEGLPPPAQAATPGEPPRHDLLVVTGGDPGTVLAAWRRRDERWRCVLDRPQRRRALLPLLRECAGNWTWLPADGVHDRDAALELLEELAGAAAGNDDLLPLLHWCRLARTHNGDLLDAADWWPAGEESPLWRRYRERVAAVPRVPLTAGDDPWARELAGRAARSTLVGGEATALFSHPDGWRTPWGVPEGTPTSWIWLDSAALHWRLLLQGEDPAAWHRRLLAGGGRHCSLLPAEPPLADAVVAQLGNWLSGDPGGTGWWRLAGVASSVLTLAVDGADPDAWVAVREAALAPLLHLADRSAGKPGKTAALLPGTGRLAPFWRAVSRDELAGLDLPGVVWCDELPGGEPADAGRLVVLRLRSLDDGRDGAPPLPAVDGVDPARRRALCGLELAARLAAGIPVVEVLDPRWARRLADPATDGPEADPAALAARWRRPGPLLLSLPAVPAWRRRRGEGTVAAAERWLRVQGLVMEDGLGLPPGIPQLPPALPPAGWHARRRRLVEGEPTAAWVAVLREVMGRRERGESEVWLLLVGSDAGLHLADDMAGDLAEVRADGVGADPVVVRRCLPAELDDQWLRQRLRERPPAVAWLADIGSYLPDAGDGGTSGARALGLLLGELDVPLVVHARHLSPAWRHYLGELLGERDRRQQHLWRDAVPLGEGPLVPVGRLADPTVRCPACGAAVALRSWTTPCGRCETTPGEWLTAAVRARLRDRIWQARLAALRRRVDLWEERPLCLWVDRSAVEEAVTALTAAGIPWRPAGEGPLATTDTGRWLLCVSGELPTPPPECHHAVLTPAAARVELADLLRSAGGEVSLWYHPLELDEARQGGVAVPVQPDDPGLAGVTGLLQGQGGLEGPWRLEGRGTPRLLEILTGRPASAVGRVLATNAWLRAASGQRLAAPPREPGPPRIEPVVSRLEMEFKLTRLVERLAPVLSWLLADVPEGLLVEADPERWPVVLDDTELALCDRALLALSDRLEPGDGGAADELFAATGGDDDPPLAFRYLAPAGLLGGTARLVGRLGTPERIAARLQQRLAEGGERLLALAADGSAACSLAEALGAGLTPADLELGLLLGFLRLEGGEVTLWPTLAVPEAEPPAAVDDAVLAPLVRSQLAAERRWCRLLEEAWRTGFVAPADLAAVTEGETGDGVGPAPERATASAAPLPWPQEGPSRQIVLRGCAGSRRAVSLVAELDRRLGDGQGRERLRVACPDAAAAARWTLAWLEAAAHPGLPRIDWPAVPSPESRLPGNGVFPLPLADEIAVLVDAERFPAEQRYRLARRHQAGTLAWLVEPFLAEGAWEHLFLTTPADDAVVDCDQQWASARRPWEWIVELLETAGRPRPRGKCRRPLRGNVRELPVANLDAALGFLDQEREVEGPACWEVVTPVEQDARYLRSVAARSGWGVLSRGDLEALLLPGALPLLAVARDLVRDPEQDGGEARELVQALLPRHEHEAYRDWARVRREAAAGWSLARLAAAAGRHGWSCGWWRDPAPRSAAVGAIRLLGERTLRELWDEPLAMMWERVLARVLGRPVVPPDRSLLMTATPAPQPAFRAERVVVLASGLEAPEFYYAAWTHVADELTVLFTERAPSEVD